MKKHTFYLLFLLILAILVACTDQVATPPTATPQPDEVPTEVNEGLEPVSCSELVTVADFAEKIFPDDSIKCAYVLVPENHYDENSPMIKLASYFIPSTSATPSADPMIYLEGGPGGAAVAAVGEFATGFATFLRERGDVIAFDQRGTGYSKPSLLCYEFSLSEDELGAAADCQERLVAEGNNLEYYNSRQNALDVQAVRKAYGYEHVNLYGISYGTRLGLTVMRDAPEGIRSVMLDSVFPPPINGLSEDVEVVYYVLDKIIETCAASEGCNADYPNLKADLEKGVLRLANSPVGEFDGAAYLQQLREMFTDEGTPEIITMLANASDADIENFLSEMLGDEEEENFVAEVLQAPADVQATLLPLVISESQGMGYSVVCAEEYPFLDNKALPEGSENWTSIRDIVSNAASPGFTPEVCTVWNVPAANVKEISAVSSDIPTLVLAGEGDIATPPSWSKLAASTLVNSQYVEFPVLGHGVLGNDCVNTVIGQFIGQPEQAVDSSCISTMPTLQYGAE